MTRTFLAVAGLFAGSAALAGPHVTTADVDATFAPPHNEPVVGNAVARYRLRLFHDIQWGRFTWEGDNSAWGMNQWQHPDAVGHGLEAWQYSDWSVATWRYLFINRLAFRMSQHFDLLAESKDTKNYPGPQGESYKLLGVRIRFIDDPGHDR